MKQKKNPTMFKECKVHGTTEFALREAGTRWRCRKCSQEAVEKRRKKVKVMSISYKGGCCQICGYDKCVRSLVFHHLDPNEKDFGISYKGHTRSWEKTKKELDKCILLCQNCHGEVHDGMHKWNPLINWYRNLPADDDKIAKTLYKRTINRPDVQKALKYAREEVVG